MIYFFAINNIGVGLSGGDTIWINLAKQWQNRVKIRVIGASEALSTLNDSSIPQIGISPKIQLKSAFSKWGIAKNTIFKLYYAIKFVAKNHKMFKDNDLVYSVSDFYPDFIPCLILKLLRPKIKWIAGFYLFAPSPFPWETPYKQDLFRGFAYWLMQRFSYPLIKNFADVVFVTSEPDAKKFKKAVVVRGGV